jgi:predicted metal-dependent phosphoesterase TrpH
VGRPHIARALVNKGYVSSVDEAFSRYLKKGAVAYVEKFRFPPDVAIDMIRKAGGIAVLAHPFTLGINKPDELALIVHELAEKGLEGIEVLYPGHTKEMVVIYEDVGKRLGLVCTGGSDFHGNFRDHSQLGSTILGKELAYKLLEDLKGKLQKRENSSPKI